jgi:hypothetical protein
MAFRQEQSRRIDNHSEGDAEASTSFPEQCGKLKVGGHIVISGKPCKIIEVNTSKKGKHGSCKARIVGKDIFTNKKMDIIRYVFLLVLSVLLLSLTFFCFPVIQ